MEFTGPCDLLTDSGECRVMLAVMEQGNGHLLARYGVQGVCDFPEWRKERSDVGVCAGGVVLPGRSGSLESTND